MSFWSLCFAPGQPPPPPHTHTHTPTPESIFFRLCWAEKNPREHVHSIIQTGIISSAFVSDLTCSGYFHTVNELVRLKPSSDLDKDNPFRQLRDYTCSRDLISHRERGQPALREALCSRIAQVKNRPRTAYHCPHDCRFYRHVGDVVA